jgi:hypothetical protein
LDSRPPVTGSSTGSPSSATSRRLEPRLELTGSLPAVDAEIPKGSYAAGRRARLPRGAAEPIRVYINGVEQTRGTDYEIRGGEIVFDRPIIKETVSPGRWMAMYLGLFGTYRKNEAVDVEYRLDGETKLAADVEIIPDG